MIVMEIGLGAAAMMREIGAAVAAKLIVEMHCRRAFYDIQFETH
jgi:hypothetical protein